MSQLKLMSEALEGWKKAALRYAEQFGWEVVPLHPNPEHGDANGPQAGPLGHRPLLEVPEGASASPEEIRGWTGIPTHAPLGLLTGVGSQVAALEVPPAEETTLTDRDLDRLREVLPDTRRIDGPGRTYHLFSFPSDRTLPVRTPFSEAPGGLVLHGERSLIRLPTDPSSPAQAAYRWDWTAPEGLAPFPESLLSFFGIQVDVETLAEWRETLTAASSNAEPTSASASGEGAPAFRTGDRLKESEGPPPEEIGLPWLAPGALTVLSGPPKTAGKSTFVVNLAAHLAAGRSFLGHGMRAIPVVMWSDLPDTQFRNCLRRTGIDDEARARLHVVHPRDVAQWSWQELLRHTFDRARHEGAGLVLLDSLDQFVRVKGDVCPTASIELAHMLTADAPTDCAVLAVKALRPSLSARIDETVEQLGVLGTAADLVLQMDRGPTCDHPTLRRLQFAGRLTPRPSCLLCEMVRGRYRCLQSGGEGRSLPSDWQESFPLEAEDGPSSSRHPRPPFSRMEATDP